MKFSRPLIKFQREKWPLRQWVLSLFPSNYEAMTYIEPYSGGGNLLFTKKPSQIEILNDIDGELIGLFHAVRDESDELIRRMNLYKYCAESFETIENKTNFEDYLDKALHDIMLRKMSKNGLKQKYAKPAGQTAWRNNISTLEGYAERMREVFILNKNALEVITAFNSPDTMLYCDPPYLYDGKEITSDISVEEHMELSRLLNSFSGKVVLSGCISPLYKRFYKNWNIFKKKINKSNKETEIIWTNF